MIKSKKWPKKDYGPGDIETWPPCTNHLLDPRTPEGPDFYWECKYCGVNEYPKCSQCTREDGKLVEDELTDGL